MRVLNFFLILFFFASCAHHTKLARKHGLSKKVQLKNIVFVPQEEFQCGPASLEMAMAHAGKKISKNILAESAFLPDKKGSLEADMKGTIRRHGLLGIPVTTLPDLFREIQDGNPVIIHQNLGFSLYPKWHYAVVVGYDLKRNKVYLHSGKTRFQEMSITAFKNTWERSGNWGVVIMIPGKINSTASELAVVEETAILEKLMFTEEALASYQAITLKWPESYSSYVGMGNILYGKNELERSLLAFEKAISLKEDSPYIWHNYAYSLLAAKRTTEAKKAAEKALLMKPSLPANYKDDLVKLITLEL